MKENLMNVPDGITVLGVFALGVILLAAFIANNNESKELPMLSGQEVRNLEVDVVDTSVIPNGSYRGRVSGYTASFQVGAAMYHGRIDHGIRGVSACTVVVKDGKITIGE